VNARYAPSKPIKCTHLLVEGVYQVDATFLVRDTLTDMQRVTILATEKTSTNANSKKNKNKKTQKRQSLPPVVESQPSKKQKISETSQKKTQALPEIEELNSSLSSDESSINDDMKVTG